MKKVSGKWQGMVLALVVLISFGIFSEVRAASDTWVPVGGKDFVSTGGWGTVNIAFSPTTNEPYIEYMDWSKGGIAIKKFDGSGWETVGNANFNSNGFEQASIAFSPESSEVYVAYSDGSSHKATVRRYDGSQWVPVGNINFTSSEAIGIKLAFSPSTKRPYVAYRNYAGKITVQEYNGSQWIPVGNTGFNSNGTYNTSFAFDPGNSQPYVAYSDWGNGKITIKKFDGSQWITVGNTNFNSVGTSYADLVFNPKTNQPYIAYGDWSGGEITVRRLEGSQWNPVGNVNFNNGKAFSIRLAFDPVSGQPYVAYNDEKNSHKVSVAKLEGSQWIPIGNSNFGFDLTYQVGIAFNPATNMPWVICNDGGGISVFGFDSENNSGISLFEPYPYGYSFVNRGVETGTLTGGVKTEGEWLWTKESIEEGSKWDIFRATFDLNKLDTVTQIKSFKDSELGVDNPFSGGNCAGMAISSLMQYKYSSFFDQNYGDFSITLDQKNNYLWNLDSINKINYGWDGHTVNTNPVLKTILSFQLSQSGQAYQDAKKTALKSPGRIVDRLQLDLPTPEKPAGKMYVISIGFKPFLGEYHGHVLVPYKVLGNRIYVYDNNQPYGVGMSKDNTGDLTDPYNKYIEVDEVHDTWKYVMWKRDGSDYYWPETSFLGQTFIELISIDDLYNGGKLSRPVGTKTGTQTFFLNGDAELSLTDDEGRITGYKDGKYYEEIPDVMPIHTNNALPEGQGLPWRQAYYIDSDASVSASVEGTNDDTYTLTHFGGDYLAELSEVPIIKGAIDTFDFSQTDTQLSFAHDQENKKYNLTLNKNNNGESQTVYSDNTNVVGGATHKYSVDWNTFSENTTPVTLQIDENSDGVFEKDLDIGTKFKDDIAPGTSILKDGQQGQNDWYQSDVEIILRASDNEGGAGVDRIEYSFDDGAPWISYSDPFAISDEGIRNMKYRSIDKLGNVEADQSVTIKIDKTAPVITGVATPTANEKGWNKDDVSVDFVCEDSGANQSGVDINTITGNTLTTDGEGQSLTNAGECIDRAGNRAASVTVSGINIDKTAPEITLETPAGGEKYVLHSTVIAKWSAADSLSGIDSVEGTMENGTQIDTSSVGPKDFSVTATDFAGNSVTEEVRYDVVYSFGGFQSPTTRDKSFNRNSTIPVKFQLTDALGKYISDAVASLKIDDKEAVSSGKSNDGYEFRYSSENNQYVFNLALKNMSLGSGVHTLKIGLDDGTSYEQIVTLK